LKKKTKDEGRRIADMQEYMLRNFQKKPAQAGGTGQPGDGETEGGSFNIKRGSKSTNNRPPSIM